jgi:predicted transcriptional regulator
MKNILMAVQPKWLAKILNWEKTDEIRKTIPECLKNGEPITVWFYCTKDYNLLSRWENKSGFGYKLIGKGVAGRLVQPLNGLVVAKCVVETYDNISYGFMNDVVGGEVLETGTPAYYITIGQIESARITYYELLKYGKTKPLSALHLTALTVLDKPMELKEFGITRAPQSWQYVEVGEVERKGDEKK